MDTGLKILLAVLLLVLVLVIWDWKKTTKTIEELTQKKNIPTRIKSGGDIPTRIK